MRSELNVTHSKKWKAEAFGDHPIAFVSWWLLRCRVVTWPGCWNRVTWLGDLPVDSRGVCLPRSRFRVGLSLVMWMASASTPPPPPPPPPPPHPHPPHPPPPTPPPPHPPLRNQSVSWGRMETSFSENECLRWLRWWPTGEELRWCSETRLRRLLSVSPTYTASQSEHWIWYTTPARSSLGTLSLGCTRRLRMVLQGLRCTDTPALRMVLQIASVRCPT